MNNEIEQLDYIEDRVINGVLCFAEKGKWTEYSKQELTEMYMSEQEYFERMINRQADEKCQ